MKALLAVMMIVAVMSAGCSSSRGQEPEKPKDPPRPVSEPDRRPPPAPEPPAPPKEAPRYALDVAGHAVRVRAALTSAERFQGLQGVKSLADDDGMLFGYRASATRHFWMKGTLIPLDIAFLDSEGTILAIETMQPAAPGVPEDKLPRTAFEGKFRFALELRAGWFQDHRVKAGARVVLPKDLPVEKAE
jgi:uncharacterized membrane protein (UPF0127 family)